MPYESKELGAAGHVLRYRLRFYQRDRAKSLTALSRTMKELGHAMTAARIGEAFNGYRRISTDELTALATALGVPAGKLVLGISPANDTSMVDQIAALELRELQVRFRRAEFAIGDIEKELDNTFLLSRRERQIAGVPEPVDILKRLEEKAIEIELFNAECERRVGEDWVSG